VKIVTPHKSEKDISVFLHIQKKEHRFEMTSVFTHGKNRLAVEGKFDLQPNNWNVNMKVKFIFISLSLQSRRSVQNLILYSFYVVQIFCLSCNYEGILV
jgi:hypothetical protein